MRMLLPRSRADLDDAALDAAYAWPDRPWVRANMVATVDGAARGPDGVSRLISSDADRRLFGRLRGLADAILVGAGTVRAEAYRPARARAAVADRRAAAGQRPAPVIAIVSRSLDLDLAAPLFAQPVERPVLLTVASAPPRRRAEAAEVAEVVTCGERSVDLTAALAALAERGLARVQCEGGPSLLAELAADGLLDELLLTITPALSGGAYAGGAAASRILSGMPLPEPPQPLVLAHLLEEDGSLFLRYRSARAAEDRADDAAEDRADDAAEDRADDAADDAAEDAAPGGRR